MTSATLSNNSDSHPRVQGRSLAAAVCRSLGQQAGHENAGGGGEGLNTGLSEAILQELC